MVVMAPRPLLRWFRRSAPPGMIDVNVDDLIEANYNPRRSREKDLTEAGVDEIVLRDPAGGVLWSRVYRSSVLVGAVWVALNTAAWPRAGIVVLAPGDEGFQAGFGRQTLAVQRSTLDAREWITFLTDRYSGLVAGGLAVADPETAASLDQVRAAVGAYVWGTPPP